MSTKPLKDKGPAPVFPVPQTSGITDQDFWLLFDITKGLVKRVNDLEEILIDHFPQLETRLGESTVSEEALSESSEEGEEFNPRLYVPMDDLVDLTEEERDYEFKDYDPAIYYV